MDDEDQTWSVRRVFMAAIFLLTGSGVALGQTSAAAVHTRLTHGRTIAITDAQSQITTGRVVTVTPAVVSVEKADRRFDVPFSEIVAIDEIDHLRNGALVGLIIGAGLFVAAAPSRLHTLTRVDSASAGRAYAAYGGIYIGALLLWLWIVEGQAPTRTDAIGAALAIVGGLVIIGFAARAR